MAKKKPKKLPLVMIEGQKNPTMLSPELINQIEQFYRMGLTDQTVSNMIGVSKYTLTEWLIRGASTNNGAHGELFKRCAKAVGSGELEYVAKIREHALGAAAVFAYRETTSPDGTVTKEVQTDNEGQPIVLKQEIKSNPQWVSWFLERRFKRAWGKGDEALLGNVALDEGIVDSLPHPKSEAGASSIPVPMTLDERLEMFDRIKSRMIDEHGPKDVKNE